MVRVYLFSLCIFLAAGAILCENSGIIERYSYHAAIEKNGSHACSGAIISDKTVLTTASCLYDTDASCTLVRVGSDQLESEGELLAVSKIILHKRYTRKRKDYDIALLVLQDKLALSDKVQAIALPQPNHILPPPQLTPATLTGFGFDADGFSDTLKAEEMIVSIPITCKNAYAHLFIYITERMFCADMKTKRNCQGDSGSPLVVDDVLVGISAWEQQCGSTRYPGIYTNIANLLKWIHAQSNGTI